ncbi:RNA methyltransferase [bacterium]|nr:RNA methyltransferase [bacterium]
MPLHIALVHHPTVDKRGNVAATSVTNLDIHDLSRIGRTYGADGIWIVHPYENMQRYVQKVFGHWKDGWGAAYNVTRKEALEDTYLATDLPELEERMEELYPGKEIVWVATSARKAVNTLSYQEMRDWLDDPDDERVFVLIFGTGWGLHPSVIQEMDYVLEPIYGPTEWNHLSVRAAAGIIIDRLLGLGRPRQSQG